MLNNYNGADGRIDVQPPAMYEYAHTYLPTILTQISNTWTNAVNTWSGLQLSWAGQTQQESDDMKRRLDDVQLRLFGKEDKSNEANSVPGILDRVRGLALAAAANYDNTESAVIDTFSRLHQSILDAENGKGGGGKPDDVTTDPIKETFTDRTSSLSSYYSGTFGSSTTIDPPSK